MRWLRRCTPRLQRRLDHAVEPQARLAVESQNERLRRGVFRVALPRLLDCLSSGLASARSPIG